MKKFARRGMSAPQKQKDGAMIAFGSIGFLPRAREGQPVLLDF
jgi:hypothetical protein